METTRDEMMFSEHEEMIKKTKTIEDLIKTKNMYIEANEKFHTNGDFSMLGEMIKLSSVMIAQIEILHENKKYG